MEHKKEQAKNKTLFKTLGASLSVRKYLLLLFGVALLLTLIITNTIVFWFVYLTEQTAWLERQNETSQRAADTVSAFLDRVEGDLTLVGSLDRQLLEAQPNILPDMLAQLPALQEVIRLDEEGHLFSEASKDAPILSNLFTISQSNWFVQASGGQTYLGNLQYSAKGIPYLIIALPTPDGGVVAARLHMEVLWHVVEDLQFGRTGVTYVVNQEGTIIAHTDTNLALLGENLNGNQDMLAMLAAFDSPATIQWDGSYNNLVGESVVAVSTQVPETNWIVITELSRSEAFNETQQSVIGLSIGAVFVGGFVLLLATRFLEKLIFQPMKNLHLGTERIRKGDLSYRIEILRQDEVGQVSHAFNQMAVSLQERDSLLATNNEKLMAEVVERKQAQQALTEARDQLEDRVLQRTAELDEVNQSLKSEIVTRKEAELKIKGSLQEKEVLLKEIHHRVKNNLQVIASMLNLQSGFVEDLQALQIFQDSQHRVEAMAAIHEKLYRSENLARIEFADYMHDLASHLFSTYEGRGQDVDLIIDADEVWLGIDTAVPCGLILNELISNAFKHAFPPGHSQGQVKLQLHPLADDKVCLCVADNGAGFPADFDFFNTSSLGLQLVNTLVTQLEGHLELCKQEGTAIRITFTVPEGI